MFIEIIEAHKLIIPSIIFIYYDVKTYYFTKEHLSKAHPKKYKFYLDMCEYYLAFRRECRLAKEDILWIGFALKCVTGDLYTYYFNKDKLVGYFKYLKSNFFLLHIIKTNKLTILCSVLFIYNITLPFKKNFLICSYLQKTHKTPEELFTEVFEAYIVYSFIYLFIVWFVRTIRYVWLNYVYKFLIPAKVCCRTFCENTTINCKLLTKLVYKYFIKIFSFFFLKFNLVTFNLKKFTQVKWKPLTKINSIFGHYMSNIKKRFNK